MQTEKPTINKEIIVHLFFAEKRNPFAITCNPGQNVWNKIEKSSKTGQDKKSLISTFACFLTATAKV